MQPNRVYGMENEVGVHEVIAIFSSCSWTEGILDIKLLVLYGDEDGY